MKSLLHLLTRAPRALARSLRLLSSGVPLLAICAVVAGLPTVSSAQTNPAVFDLSTGSYTFTEWAATSAANTYPANMRFHRSATQDPGLAVDMTADYTAVYNGTSGSRINGEGTSGVGFINTGSSGNIGAAVLGLNSTGRSGIQVTWTGGLVSVGDRVYAIRLQYRVGTGGTWTDVAGPAEYSSSGKTAGASQVVGPTTLPTACENQSAVYLRLKYYSVSGTSGTRPKLRFDELTVSSSANTTPTITGAATATSFTTTYGAASTAQTFTVGGTNLSADLTATAPTGFEVSSDAATFGSTATFTQASGTASGTLSVRLAATATVAGTYNAQNIVLSSTGATSVNIATSASGNTVSAAPLSITGVNADAKTYDGNTAATFTGTAAYSGLVNGEAFAVTGTPSASFATAAAGNDKPVTVTGYTAPSSNYTVSQPTGLVANINPATLTVTASNITKPSGTELTSGPGSLAFTSSGLVGTETIGSVTITYGSGAAAGDAAATYTGSAVPLDATGGTFTATNYAISYVAGDIIVSAAPTLSAVGTLTALNATYGTASATTTFSVSGGNLTGDITVTAPAGFEVSTTPGTGFSSSATLTPTTGTLASTTLYVRLTATAPAGSYSGDVTVSGGSATTQNVATVLSTVAPKELTITGVTADSKVYDGGTTAALAGTAAYTGLENGESFAVTGTPSAAFGNKAVGTAKPVTITGYTAPSTNYTVSQPTGVTADVTAKALTVTGAAVTTKAFDNNFLATITGTLVGVVAPDEVTLVGTGTFADLNVGSGIAVTSNSTLLGADATNYTLTQPTGLTGDITQGSQTITFNALPGKTATDAAFALTATASSGLPVSYISSNPAVATISGDTVTIVGVGTTTITAAQAGNTNYAAATSVDQTQVVTAGPTVLAAGDIAVVGYNTSGSPDSMFLLVLKDLNAGTTFYVNDNEVASDGAAAFTDLGEAEATFTVSAGQMVPKGTVIRLPWGNEAVTSSLFTWTGHTSGGLGNNNEEIYVYTAPAVTATTPTAFIYGVRIGGSTSSRPAGLTTGSSFIAPTGAAARYKVTGATYAGTVPQLLNAIGNTASNWEAVAPSAIGDWTFSILTPQTITFGPLASRTFGDATFELSATADSGLAVSYASSNTNVATISGSTVTIVGGGSTTITASQAGNSVFGAATDVQQTLTVGKAAQTISGLSATDTRVFGDAPYSPGATASSGLAVSYASSNTDVATASGSTITIVGAGTTTITASQIGNDNYNAATDATQTLTVDPKAVTVTAGNVTKPFGTSLIGGPGFTGFSAPGLVGSDTIGSVTVAYGAGASAGDAVNTYVGSVVISAATGGSFTPANYALSYAAGDIIISASPIISVSGTLTAVSATYAAPSATASLFEVSGGNLSGDLSVSAPAGFEVSTSLATGYASTLDLTQAGGSVASSTIYVRLAAGTAAGSYAGNVTVSGGGATVQMVSIPTSTVTPKPVTITGLTADSKAYDRSPAATLTGTAALSGVVSGDEANATLAGTATATFATATAGPGKTVNVAGFSLTGSASANYSLTALTLTADVTPVAVTIPDAAVVSKSFDGTTAATITGTLSGVIAPDVVSLVGAGTFASANVGTGIAVTSTSTLAGVDSANYSITQPVGLTGNIVGSSNANLTNLTVSSGTLSPTFAASLLAPYNGLQTSFLHIVPNATTSLTLTPTLADLGASVTVNGAIATSGSPSGSITLNEGFNTITVVVTAGDLSTTKTFTVTAIRQSSAALTAGSIAFTGFNADVNDNLAFVALTAIPQNTVIFFTDEEWDGSNWATFTECSYIWVANSNVSAGQVVTMNDLANVFTGGATSNLGTLIGVNDGNNNAGMGASDEAVFAFQGTGALATTTGAPTTTDSNLMPVPSAFLAVIANEDAAGAGYSLTGTGLSEAAGTAIIFPDDDDGMRYKGSRTGELSFAAYLPLLANRAANWDTILGGDGSTYLPFNTAAFALGSPVSVSIAAAAVAEGNSGTVTLNLPVTRSDTTTAFTVDYAVTGGTATSGTDYVALANGTLTFAVAGDATQNIAITVNGDTNIESNETVIVTLSNLTAVTGSTTISTAAGTGTITSDDVIPVTYPATNALTSTVKGFVTLPGAEIPTFDPGSKRAFASSDVGIQVVDLTDPANPVIGAAILPASLGVSGLTSNNVSSIAVRKGTGGNPSVLAAAMISSPKTAAGYVVFLNAADGSLLGSAVIGANPDHIGFTPDGTKLLVANEGELDGTAADVAADTTLGTVSIIDISTGFASPTVTTADFTAYDSQVASLRLAGVRIFKNASGVDALPSLDFEPEYIAISADSTKAMVTLQEANALAVLDIATATFTSVVPLGKKDFSTVRTDLSDRDGAGSTALVNPVLGNRAFGLYMPDAIASYSFGGQAFYVTANEGDDRNDFLNPDEITTVSAAGYDLDDAVFPDEATLKTNAVLGRLGVSNATGLRGDTDNDGDIDEILSLGARSFSIHNAAGQRIFDSGDMIEMIIASQHLSNFDDSRSDNKGPEPEGVITATIGGRTYAFVAIERSGMVLVFDITNPAAVTYTSAFKRSGDFNPEGMVFVSAADSPSAKPLLISANESSSTLTVFEITQNVDYTLQLLHLSDGEAGLLAAQTAPNLAALVDAFDNSYSNTLILAGGDNFLPGPFLNAGTDPTVGATHDKGTNPAAADIEIHNRLGVEASTVGNHEFDLGTTAFSDAINDTNFPYLSANLNFSGDSAISARFQNTVGVGGLEEASTLTKKIVPSAVITKGGQKIGLVGATTQIVERISSTGNVEVNGFTGDGAEVDDMALLATQLQPVIDDLRNQGVNKIVLMAHLQQIANEQALAPLLNGVDVILAAGSNTRLGDSNDVPALFPGHAADFANNYPILTAGADGAPTVIVNTDNEFTYLGRLVIDFDSNGVLVTSGLANELGTNGAYAATAANVASAWGVAEANLATTAFASGTKGARVKQITDAVQSVIAAKDGTVYGYTNFYLEGERSFVRNQETNLGNLSADSMVKSATVALPSNPYTVALKNGGGIRAQIGSVDFATGAKLPPAANASAGKASGGVSLLDIENSMRFNNRLMICDTTAAGLKAILEHGVFALGTQGRFPQIGGVRFSFDSAAAAGSRVRNVVLTNSADQIIARLVIDGVVQTNVPAVITLTVLNFLAQGGDSYPIKANADNFRYILSNGTASAAISESLDFSAAANVPANALGEQQALQEFLVANHSTPVLAYNKADTPIAQDTRVQQIAFRTDAVNTGDSLDAPTAINSTGNTVAQGNAPDTVVSTLVAVDANAGDTHTFTLVPGASDTDNASFSIVGNQLRIQVTTDAAVKDLYRVRVRATDSSPLALSFEAPLAISVISPGTVSLDSATVTVNHGSSDVTLGLTRSGGDAATSVLVNTANGTALAGGDYIGLTNQVVNFGSGQNTASVVIQLTGAAIPSLRLFTASISRNASGASVSGVTTATIRIRKDFVDPVVAIAAPAASAVVKEPTTASGAVKIEGTLNGTVGDPTISTVTISVNGGSNVPAVISTDRKKWSVTLTGAAAVNAVLTPGTNSVVARGTDADGNVGISAARSFTYEVARTLAFSVTPVGPPAGGVITFAPALDSGKAIIGRTYTITGAPTNGFFFSSWSGTAGLASTTTPTTTFTFQEGVTLVANFVASPFTSDAVGVYNGVLKGAVDNQDNSGIFSAAITLNNGAFTGKVNLDGAVTSIAGVFNNVTGRFTSTNTNGYSYDLTVNLASPVRRITGSITKSRRGTPVAVIAVDAAQAYNKSTAQPAAGVVGTFNVAYGVPVAPVSLTVDDYPQGNGYGIMSVSSTDGTSVVAGILADGTVYTSSSILCRDNSLALYASFASRTGAICGKLTVASEVDSDVTGAGIRWFRAEHTGQYYPFGYDTGLTVTAVGARQAGSIASSLGLSGTPTLALQGGPIIGSLNKQLAGSGLSFQSTDKIAKVVFTTGGLMSGEYSPSGMASKHLIRGIIVGKGGSGEAYGYILSPTPAHTDGAGVAGVATINP